jgi:FMN phosphatase YigB (HAD superfamily)
MNKNIKTIKNYDEINVEMNTMVFMDIDNTIIKFEKLHKTWWEENKTENKSEPLDKWLKIIKEDTPIMLDKNKFLIFLEKIKETNSDIKYITARYESLRELTYHHLVECEIPVNKDNVYHCYPKGDKILEICNEITPQNIIFIDDHLDNIENVMEKLKEYNVDYYLIHHSNLH